MRSRAMGWIGLLPAEVEHVGHEGGGVAAARGVDHVEQHRRERRRDPGAGGGVLEGDGARV